MEGCVAIRQEEDHERALGRVSAIPSKSGGSTTEETSVQGFRGGLTKKMRSWPKEAK